MLAPLENAGLKSNIEHNLYYKEFQKLFAKIPWYVNLQR